MILTPSQQCILPIFYNLKYNWMKNLPPILSDTFPGQEACTQQVLRGICVLLRSMSVGSLVYYQISVVVGLYCCLVHRAVKRQRTHNLHRKTLPNIELTSQAVHSQGRKTFFRITLQSILWSNHDLRTLGRSLSLPDSRGLWGPIWNDVHIYLQTATWLLSVCSY